MEEVYIIDTSSFLPNTAVTNDVIEEYMGFINGTVSRTKNIILRNNKIKERFYAIDKDGESTHTNAEMVSLAVRKLLKNNTDPIELLACGTSSPDQLMPSHGVMVHGELPELGSIEVISPSGVCCSGMHALKYSFLSIKTGDKKTAVATGSERIAKTLRSENYQEELEELEEITKVEEKPILAFEKDFLRWMLSDGAGAFLLNNTPNKKSNSLRIDWMEAISYADTEPVCMYMGSDFDENGKLLSYKDFSQEDLIKKSIFSIKQNTKILGEKIVRLGFDKLADICKKHNYDPSTVDHFLPHLSSFFFEDKIDEVLRSNDIVIPEEKWFTNLATKGNVGSGSIYLMVDELFKSNKLSKGETVLLAVPESSRFSYVFCLLTVV